MYSQQPLKKKKIKIHNIPFFFFFFRHFNLVWIEEKGETLVIRCPNRRLIVHFQNNNEKMKWYNEIIDCIFRSLVPYPMGGTPPKSVANPTPPPLRYGEFTCLFLYIYLLLLLLLLLSLLLLLFFILYV